MSTRYIQKYDTISEFEHVTRDLPTSQGIGAVGGAVVVNNGGTARQLGVAPNTKAYFVDPQNGSDASTRDGLSWSTAFASMSPLDSVLSHGDTVYLTGVLKQNWVPTVLVNDVTIIGVGNQPRQATDSGVANGGGATWLNPGTVASPLLHLGNFATDHPMQAWRIQNIFFNNAGDAPCIIFDRKITGADSSHASVYGCKFTGANSGISTGEVIFLTIEGCTFFDFIGSGDTGIKANIAGGIANPPYLGWKIRGNKFENNVNHIVGALRNAEITDNDFSWKGRSVTTTLQLDLTGGINNNIMANRFGVGHSESGSAGMFLPQDTLNSWNNWYRTGLTALVPATA